MIGKTSWKLLEILEEMVDERIYYFFVGIPKVILDLESEFQTNFVEISFLFEINLNFLENFILFEIYLVF